MCYLGSCWIVAYSLLNVPSNKNHYQIVYLCYLGDLESLHNLLNVRQDPRQYASILSWFDRNFFSCCDLYTTKVAAVMETKKKHICIITNLLRKSVTVRIFTFSGYYKPKGHYYTVQCQINPSSQFFIFRFIVLIDDLAKENEASKLESLTQVI